LYKINKAAFSWDTEAGFFMMAVSMGCADTLNAEKNKAVPRILSLRNARGHGTFIFIDFDRIIETA